MSDEKKNDCCPHCGYCPHCGRSAAPYVPMPYYPVPIYPRPYYPWWQQGTTTAAPVITWGHVNICGNTADPQITAGNVTIT